MSNIYNIKTPAEGQAASSRGDYGLENLGLINLRETYWNLPMEALYEESVFRGEANISRMGPLIVKTGKHTARAAALHRAVHRGSERHLRALRRLAAHGQLGAGRERSRPRLGGARAGRRRPARRRPRGHWVGAPPRLTTAAFDPPSPF